jgi:hypothetical protein
MTHPCIKDNKKCPVANRACYAINPDVMTDKGHKPCRYTNGMSNINKKPAGRDPCRKNKKKDRTTRPTIGLDILGSNVIKHFLSLINVFRKHTI